MFEHERRYNSGALDNICVIVAMSTLTIDLAKHVTLRRWGQHGTCRDVLMCQVPRWHAVKSVATLVMDEPRISELGESVLGEKPSRVKGQQKRKLLGGTGSAPLRTARVRCSET